jgi:hypothetical protein
MADAPIAAALTSKAPYLVYRCGRNIYALCMFFRRRYENIDTDEKEVV